jgi:hypothetical protein
MNTRSRLAFAAVLSLGITAAAWFLIDGSETRTDLSKIKQPVRVALEARDEESMRSAIDFSPGAASTSDRDWLRSYHESTDDFSLTRDLVDAARVGDARAEFVLGRVLLRCEIIKRTLAPYTIGSLDERVERYLLDQPNMAVVGGSEFRQRALRCEGMLDDHSLFEAGLAEHERDFGYWAKRAVDSGDPLAAVEHASRLVASRSEGLSADAEQAYRERLMKDVHTVVSSKDVAALFAVGALFSHPSVVADPDHGYAWQIAACEAGYDCSNANPEIGLGCVAAFSCVDDLTWQDKMQRDFGPAKYAALYAVALDIEYKVRTDDWDGLQQYLKIK